MFIGIYNNLVNTHYIETVTYRKNNDNTYSVEYDLANGNYLLDGKYDTEQEAIAEYERIKDLLLSI
jgi:hypothetical protein